jgi:hypothetical protein
MIGQVLPDAFAAGQAGRGDCGCRDDLIGEELPSQQVGTVHDPEEDPFQGFAALAGGLGHEHVEEVKGAVVAERACTPGPHVSLPSISAAPRSIMMYSMIARVM